MLEFSKRVNSKSAVAESLTLPYRQRQKSRQRVVLDSGKEAGILLDHGKRLHGGDILCTRDGYCLRVIEALEPVSTVFTNNSQALARASYHVGNRHIPIQIGKNWIRYERDHVVDDMIRRLDLTPKHEIAPFEPEDGAYNKHSHENKDSRSPIHSDLKNSTGRTKTS